jgi:hypothetical protein
MMDGPAIADLKSITAPLNFLVPMAEKPVAYNYEPPPGVPVRTGESEEHWVKIRDARPLIGQLSLDREGFVLLRHQSAVQNFYDEEEIARVYYPECERVIKEATGAARVVAFDHIVRNAAMSAKGNAIKMPAKRVHDDYTAWSAPQRVRDLMGAEAEELLKHRFSIINLWRPISGPVMESPLVLCDAQSLAEENLIASDLKYPDRTGETYSITYNPDRYRQVEFQDIAGEFDLLVGHYPHEDCCLTIADMAGEGFAGVSNQERVEQHRRKISLQCRNRADLL